MFIDRPDIEPGIKIAAQITPEPTPEDTAFIKQMGVDHVVLWTTGEKASYDYYASRRELFADAGLNVYGFGSWSVHSWPMPLRCPPEELCNTLPTVELPPSNLGNSGIALISGKSIAIPVVFSTVRAIL